MFLKMSSGRNVYFVFLKREITKYVKLRQTKEKPSEKISEQYWCFL